MSMAIYFWPNPDTPNHLPYVRRDGYHNPETKTITDEASLNRMANASRSLALGYYFTGDEIYAHHAALLLRAWFNDPATAMNPNLKFAQFVKGQDDGRCFGILDGRRLTQAIDAAGMLAGSKEWTAADDAGLRRWFSDYYTWLTTSEAGKAESTQPNNHGSWFLVQAMPIALFLGKTDDARHMAEQVRNSRIPSQIDSQGMQTHEIKRNQSLAYSAFNLEALTQVATVAAPLGIDLYRPVTPGAPGILTAVDAIMPFDPQHPWPNQQVSTGKEDSLCPALISALTYTHKARYADAMKRFQCQTTALTLITVLGAS
jgi:hypothetical protein